MRYIDNSALKPSEAWEAKARIALTEVATVTDAERAREINKRAAIWGDLKSELMRLSAGKCWYCESRELRSDNAVDHFRPKNNVKGSTAFPMASDHPGYWWLAFNCANYRFSCTFCNSIRKSAAGTGGKHDYFPLLEDERRAKCAQDDLDKENPVLLDPTNAMDCDALWFDDRGGVSPRPPRPNEPDPAYKRWQARAGESIRYYHLNHPNIAEARMHLASEIRRLAAEADKWLRRLDNGEPGAPAEARDKLAHLLRTARPESEYSAAAKCILRGLRASSPAANVVLDQL